MVTRYFFLFVYLPEVAQSCSPDRADILQMLRSKSLQIKAKAGNVCQNMKIRKGEIADMARVLELIRELALYEKEPHAVVLTLEDLQRDGFSAAPLFTTFVAEVDSVIVGVALYYYRYSTWKGRTIHLEDLIVTQEFRGKGIGLALYKQVIFQGKNDGVRRIEWNVLDWNAPAIAFYETSGARILKDWQVVQMDEIGIQKFTENK